MKLKADNFLFYKNGKFKIMDFFLVPKEPEEMVSQNCSAHLFGSPEHFLGKCYDGPKEETCTSK